MNTYFFIAGAALSCAVYLFFILHILQALSRVSRYRPPDAPPETEISVIIAAHNEARVIGETLRRMIVQKYPTEKYEIIVAADRCSDETEKIVSAYCREFPQVQILPIPQHPENFAPKKFALQSAIARAKFDHLVLMDADCQAGPEYLAVFNRHFAAGAEVVINIPKVHILKKRLHFYLLPERLSTWAVAALGVANKNPFLAFGGSWGYRKALLDRAGGFSNIRASLSGDDDLLVAQFAKISQNIVLNILPQGWVKTDLPESLGKFIRQRRRHHSAGKKYARKVQTGYMLFHISHYALWMMPFLFPPLLLFLIIKIIADILALKKAALLFKEQLTPANFLYFEIGFLLHNLFLAPAAWFGKIRWK